MIKELCNQIGRKHISVDELKLCVLNWGITLLFHSKSINLSFWAISNLTIASRSTKVTHDKSMVFKVSLPCLVLYWFSLEILMIKESNNTIGRLFWSVNWNSMYLVKKKINYQPFIYYELILTSPYLLLDQKYTIKTTHV